MSSAYSFQDVSASFDGPTGQVDLGYGSMNADEGITIEASSDKNKMDIGGDGNGQHNLSADKSGVVTCRFLKTSPVNQQLQLMYDAQILTATLWGQNVIVVQQSAAGDLHTCRQVAFKKKPRIVYSKNAELMEWTFDAIKIDSILGSYQ